MRNPSNMEQSRVASVPYPGNSYIDVAPAQEPTLSEYISVMLQNWKLIVTVAAVVIALGVSYALLAKPAYRADAMIQVEDPTANAKQSLGELSSLFDTTATASAEIELIKSRLVVQKTVQDLHLDILATANTFPVIGDYLARRAKPGVLASPLFGLQRFAWGGEKIAVSRFDLPYDTGYTLVAGKGPAFEIRNDDDEVVALGTVGKPGIANIEGQALPFQVDTLVANPGTRFSVSRSRELDAIGRLQDDLVVEEKTKQSGVISVTLDGRDSDRVTRVVNDLADNYVAQNVKRKRDEAQSTLDFLATQLPTLKTRLEASENAYNAFRNRRGTVDLSEESKLLLGQLVDTKAKQIDLEQKRNELQLRFSDDHPAVLALSDNISALAAVQRELSGRVQALPNTEQEALRLLRDVRVNTQLYTNMLNSSQQLSVIEAGQVGNVRVVDRAMRSDKPVKPKKLIVIGISIVLGILLGTAIPFVRRSLQVRIENTDQIERILGVPVYSVVPHSSRQSVIERQLGRGRSGGLLLAESAQDDVAIEAIRSLQTALYFSAGNAVNNVILITGSRPDVGKSFLAANLATVLAGSGKRVLLIDADLRRGNVHTYFGKAMAPGLSDALTNSTLDALVHSNVQPGLDFLARGAVPGNPAELLMSGGLKTLLEQFSGQYDAVVVDSPPVIAVTDSMLIARYAGTTLLAVRHGQQTASELSEAARRMRNSDVVVNGVVFTDVPQSRLGFGSYAMSYYKYESR
jgi:tyrosine-protein kinase Etk/Wzc